jgi:hypothetical protein
MLSHPPKIAMVDSSAWARASSGLWWLAEFIPRWELDYSTSPPSRKLVRGNTGRRHQDSRGGKVLIHESVRDWPTKNAAIVVSHHD